MLKSLILAPFDFSPSRHRTAPKTIRAHGSVNTKRLVSAYALIALNVFLLGWYLVGVNTYAAQGYEMKTIQTQIAALDGQNQKLNLQISEESSLAALRDDFANSEFVAVGQPKYLQIDDLSMK